ncbi:TPA_asm: P3 [Zanthoxylum betacytorhabdovirus 1]|nr:TPA_asm: P3 [Zanthoxilum betacytorhabdovirus 1]
MDIMKYQSDEGSNKKNRMPDGKLFNIKMKKEVIERVYPRRIRWSSIKKMKESLRGKSVRVTSVQFTYIPYISSVSGSVVLNIYDMRHTNPRMRLLLHTSFPASKNQYIDMAPNVVFDINEEKDALMIELFSNNVELENDVIYGILKAKCNFAAYTRHVTGDTPTLQAVPALAYTRGDLLTSDQLESLTMKHGFVGPPLSVGSDYVLQGIGATSKIIGSSEIRSHGASSKYSVQSGYKEEGAFA